MRKGWQNLYKPPKPAVKAVVREFHANLNEQVEKKVRCEEFGFHAIEPP